MVSVNCWKNSTQTKTAGSDGIKPRVLQELSDVIAPIFTVIFQKSLDTGMAPAYWRSADVSLVYKKSDRYKTGNYCPISLTCICCKLMEHIVISHIMKHTDNIMLIATTSCIRSNMAFAADYPVSLSFLNLLTNCHQQHGSRYPDFCKAFDKVSHIHLIHKLNHYGIRNKFNTRIHSLLIN